MKSICKTKVCVVKNKNSLCIYSKPDIPGSYICLIYLCPFFYITLKNKVIKLKATAHKLEVNDQCKTQEPHRPYLQVWNKIKKSFVQLAQQL